jgi:hypothetical protein
VGYYLYDANGYLSDAATISGWGRFARWALRQRLPELRRFVYDGASDHPRTLAAELESVRIDGELDVVRRIVLEAAKRADSVLILTDGAGFETEDGDEGG